MNNFCTKNDRMKGNCEEGMRVKECMKGNYEEGMCGGISYMGV